MILSDNATLQELDRGMFLARNPDWELRVPDPSPQNWHGILLLLQLTKPDSVIVSLIYAALIKINSEVERQYSNKDGTG